MKNTKKLIFLAVSLMVGVLTFQPALSFLVTTAEHRPSREIKMEVVGIGVSKYGIVLKFYSPLCFFDAGNSNRFAECATAIYSLHKPLYTSIEYDKNGKVLEIFAGNKAGRNEAIQMTAEYRKLFLRKYPGYTIPDLPQKM